MSLSEYHAWREAEGYASCMRSAEFHRSRAAEFLSRGDRLGARAFAAAWVSWLQFTAEWYPNPRLSEEYDADAELQDLENSDRRF